MAVYALGELVPEISPDAFVHPDAVVVGRVHLAGGVTVWPAAVLRGDFGEIRVGPDTSVQDGAVLHATAELPTVVGRGCVIGHLAHLEGCTVEDGALVGSGALVLHRARVGTGALVAAGSVVTPGTAVPAGSRVAGVPARPLAGPADPAEIADAAARYVRNGHRYAAELRRLDPDL
ncbi:MAG: gamma carbonic anhydrase family protein [Actinomycetota bacterium]